jgi:hypothetical protein
VRPLQAAYLVAADTKDLQAAGKPGLSECRQSTGGDRVADATAS